MKEILEKLVNGEINADEAEHLLKADNILEFDNIAKYDIKRNERTGFPEAVFSPSKDYEDLLTIIRNYLEKSDDDLIITKLTNERHDRILEDLGENSYIFDYNRRAQILIIRKELAKRDPIAKIGIITAGTSDINIAEEARVIVEEGGCEAITSYDIGVAGIHRLFPQIAHMTREGVQSLRVLLMCRSLPFQHPSVMVLAKEEGWLLTQCFNHAHPELQWSILTTDSVPESSP